MNEQFRYSSDPVDLQALFPGSREHTYLSTCTRGLLPVPAREALDDHLDGLQDGTTDKNALFSCIERTRASFGRLIKCEADEVAFTKNVSEGLNIIAAAMDWQPGDNVVVCLDVEHPNNVYPWLNLRERMGVDVRSVPQREGHVDVHGLIDAMDGRTRLVTLPTVSFSPGFRTDVATVGDVCRERDVFLLADAVQSAGILDTDVGALKVDGLAVSTQKGLCGLYGMGFLYCRRAWAERMTPAYLARFGVDLGDAHEAAFGSDNYSLMPAARRFDVGNYNYPGAVVADQSLAILNGIGTQVIEAHVLGLAKRLIDGVLELGLPVPGGEAGAHTSSIISIGKVGAGGHDTSDDPMVTSLSACLSEHDVVHTIRRGMVRLALHIYNTEDDIDRVLDVAKAWTAKHSPT